MATQRISHTTGRNTTMTMVGAASLLAAIMIGLLIVLRPATPAAVPEKPVVAPAAPARFPGMSNRYFADEIAGASAQYADPASITGPPPESLLDLPRPVAPASAAPQAPFSSYNRFFADEVIAGTEVPHWTVLDVAAMLPLHGPR